MRFFNKFKKKHPEMVGISPETPELNLSVNYCSIKLDTYFSIEGRRHIIEVMASDFSCQIKQLSARNVIIRKLLGANEESLAYLQ